MKKAKIDDDYFNEKEKSEETEKNSKQNLNSKKGKKNKGEDFLEYAVKNGIQVNFEYEDKLVKNHDRNFDNREYRGKPTNNYEKSKRQDYNKPNYSEGTYKKYSKPYNSYKKPFYGNKMRDLHKMGNNKFDLCNPQMPRMMDMSTPMYGSYNSSGGDMQPGIIQNQNDELRLRDTSDESILLFLTNYLSSDNLNRDLYLRNRIDENGFIDLVGVAEHKKLKFKGVTWEKLVEILKPNQDHPVIEVLFDEEKISLRNRNWDNIKETLLNVSEIYHQKKIAKKNAYLNPMNNMNYVGMQNNYFFNSIPTPNPEDFSMKMMGGYPMMMGFPGYQAYQGYQYPMMGMSFVNPSVNVNESQNYPEENN